MSAWDLHVHSVFIENRSDFLTWVIVPFTKATGPTAMAIIAIVVSLILYLRERRKGSPRLLVLLPALGVLLANGTSFVLKRLINRHRPPLEDQLLYHFNPSMPSGHAVGAFAFSNCRCTGFQEIMDTALFLHRSRGCYLSPLCRCALAKRRCGGGTSWMRRFPLSMVESHI